MDNIYTVELRFNTSITLDVRASDEGDALGKARELAEMAPMTSFHIIDENDSRIVNVSPLQERRNDE